MARQLDKDRIKDIARLMTSGRTVTTKDTAWLCDNALFSLQVRPILERMFRDGAQPRDWDDIAYLMDGMDIE